MERGNKDCTCILGGCSFALFRSGVYNGENVFGEEKMELLTKASYSGEISEREKRNLEVAYRAACESMVLLKNENVLPLKTKKVAL